MNELRKIKNILTEKKQNGLIYSRYIENLLREIFCFTMCDLLADYAKYLTFMEDFPLFNTESFVANKPKVQKKFFSDFSSTQIFRQFLQNDSKENFPYFYKIENKIKNEINSNSRQSCFTPRTSNLDVSKYFHVRSHSNNLLDIKNQVKVDETSRINDISGARKSESNLTIKDLNKVDQSKSIKL